MKRLALISLLLLTATACGPGRVPPPKNAQHYLQEGEKSFEQGLYEEAIASWEKVRDSFYSPELNTLADLKIAEAHFLAEHYPEAAAAYEDFLKEHPDHERTAHVLYQLGMAYYRQLRAADQDQTATRNAKITFETLLKRFPDFEQASVVKTYIGRCVDLLADHELYVGRFYLRTGHPAAAVGRLEGIFDRYPNYFRRDKAYFYLGKAYLEQGKKEKAVETFNRLYEQFPRSEHVIHAQRLMAKHY